MVAPALTRRLLHAFTNALPTATDRPASEDPRLQTLTERELEVLRAVAAGLTNNEIARDLQAVRIHGQDPRGRALAKIGARDRSKRSSSRTTSAWSAPATAPVGRTEVVIRGSPFVLGPRTVHHLDPQHRGALGPLSRLPRVPALAVDLGRGRVDGGVPERGRISAGGPDPVAKAWSVGRSTAFPAGRPDLAGSVPLGQDPGDRGRLGVDLGISG